MRTKRSITEFIVAMLVFLFLYTALSKIADQSTFKFSLRGSPILKNFTDIVAIGIPLLEIAIVVTLAIPKTRLIGLYSSTILLSLFTIYLIGMLSFSKHLPCGCGGVISKMGWKMHVFFNIFFIILSIIATRLQKTNKNAIPATMSPAA